jgi:hypothetical protein
VAEVLQTINTILTVRESASLARSVADDLAKRKDPEEVSDVDDKDLNGMLLDQLSVDYNKPPRTRKIVDVPLDEYGQDFNSSEK